MRLLKLSCDNSNFKTLDFSTEKSTGLSIVVGLQITKDQKESINGIGKSLSLNMIHYMLGADLPKKLKPFLSEYGIFRLEFAHNHKFYVVEKDFKQSSFDINGQKLKLTDYREKLNRIVLGETTTISFRQLFNCFARRYEKAASYYTGVLTQQGISLKDYAQNFVNLYLLGIDTHLVEQKCQAKEKLQELSNSLKSVENYINTDNAGKIKDLQDEIDNLMQSLLAFSIAPDYEKLKKQADDLTATLDQKRTNIYFLEKQLNKKQVTLKNLNNINVDIEQIADIFEEAQFFFTELITKRLSDTQDFHNNLVNNRKQRLKVEIQVLKQKIATLADEKETVGAQRDVLLQTLEKQGALEDRDTITKRINTLELQKNELEKYKNLRDTIEKDKRAWKTRNATLQQNSFTYLDQEKDKLDTIENQFRSLVKEFYNNHGGSLTVTLAKDAKYLFDIAVNIPADNSQGRGGVEIFCYDVLLYLLNKELLGFLAHDGCLFSGMDPRQKATIFKIILKLCQTETLQYFVNVSQNTLKEVMDSDVLTEQEKQTVNNSIILRLYDKNPKNWLFGESFD